MPRPEDLLTSVAAAMLTAAFVLSFLLINLHIKISQMDRMRDEAVERGFAEWVKETNGITRWKWKDKNLQK